MQMTEAGNRRRLVSVGLMVIVTALVFFIAVWFGEENRPARGLGWLLYRGGLCGLLAATGVFVVAVFAYAYFLARRLGPYPTVVAGFTSFVIFASVAGGFVVGDRSRSRAINQCFSQGEEIRRALEGYRSLHGSYPQFLGQLPDIRLPGRRLLRGTVLEYERTKTGYILVVQDPIMISSATETQAFISSK